MAGIYVHIPFCKKACHYCDFHFTTTQYYRDEIIKQLANEIEQRKNYLAERKLNTIYFGGGTPSILNEEELSLLMKTIHKNFSVAEKPEITLEANPDDLSIEKLLMLKKTGINRLSIGVQSFRDEDLKWMNRAHDAIHAKQAVINAASAGFNNISIDLIYGLPTSKLADWKKNLEEAVTLPVQHLSCYCLTVEDNTALHHFIKKGKVIEKKDEVSSEEFLMAHEFLTGNGFEHYEISNYGLRNFHSRHNSSYWDNEPYLGIGPSAHSYNGISRQWNVANNIQYLNSMKEGKLLFEKEELSIEQQFNEYLMTRLRTSSGISMEYIESFFGEIYADELRQKISAYEIPSHFEIKNNNLQLTIEGMLKLNSIVIEWMK